MDLHCAVCGTDLPADAAHSLVYCAHCGAPQLCLHEELAERADQRRAAADERDAEAATGSTTRAQPAPGEADWPAALQLVGLSAATMLLLTLAAVVMPGVGLLSGLWFIASPIIVLGAYGARARRSRITAGLGARLGLLTGLGNLLAMSALKTVQFDLLRHAGQLAGFDAVWTGVMQQSAARAVAMSGDSTVLAALRQPEFRIGWILASFGMFAFVLLLLATIGGAFAGLLRSREGSRGGA